MEDAKDYAMLSVGCKSAHRFGAMGHRRYQCSREGCAAKRKIVVLNDVVQVLSSGMHNHTDVATSKYHRMSNACKSAINRLAPGNLTPLQIQAVIEDEHAVDIDRISRQKKHQREKENSISWKDWQKQYLGDLRVLGIHSTKTERVVVVSSKELIDKMFSSNFQPRFACIDTNMEHSLILEMTFNS